MGEKVKTIFILNILQPFKILEFYKTEKFTIVEMTFRDLPALSLLSWKKIMLKFLAIMQNYFKSNQTFSLIKFSY